MTTPTHFHDFKPCEAVQYDWPHDADEAHYDAVFANIVDMLAPRFAVSSIESVLHVVDPESLREIATAKPGQWLVKQGGRVWVQDEEPARVERWMLGEIPSDGRGWSADEVWELQSAFHEKATHRRPVLSNGWVGPWEECG